MVVAPQGASWWRDPDAVTMAEVLEKCEEKQLPLLLTPPYNISRQMVDAAFAGTSRVPLVDFIVENPDSYTRWKMALHGHGIAVVTADALPESEERYPKVVLDDGGVLSGFHTLSWKPGRTRVDEQSGEDVADLKASSGGPEGDKDDLEVRRRWPPSGVTPEAHQLLRTALKEQILKKFIGDRQGVYAPGSTS